MAKICRPLQLASLQKGAQKVGKVCSGGNCQGLALLIWTPAI